MKNVLLVVLALFALPTVAHAQRRGTDFNNEITECKGLIPITRANTAATGAWCSMLGYNAAVAVVQSGLMDATSQYIVLQDSTVGSAVAAVDSVNVGTDSTTSVMAYNGTGRFVRVLLRASGGAGDSSWVSSVIIRGYCRTKAC